MKGTLGGTQVRLKSSLINEETAYKIFVKELLQFKDDIIRDGALHFNFVSDPCTAETIVLYWACIDYAISQGVPAQVLTKRADWLNHPAVQNALSRPELIAVGFSLTGRDDLGASPNEERIAAMQMLYDAGVPTWASIEPIIDPQSSYDMIARTIHCCGRYKIGILSGKKSYTPQQIRDFVTMVNALRPKSVYWKQSLLEFVQKP